MLENIQYNIHGFIRITIDSNVPKEALAVLNGYLGYFKNKKYESKAQLVEIRIHPLALDILKNSKNVKEANKGEYQVNNNFILFRDKGFALNIDRSEIHLYVSGASIPINFIINLGFIENDITLIHSAAAEDRMGNVILFPGFSKAGKTSILGQLIKKWNFRILGDDLIGITSKGICYSFPRQIAIKQDNHSILDDPFSTKKLVSKKATTKIKTFLKDNIPFKGIIKNHIFSSKIGKIFINFSFNPAYLEVLPVEKVYGKNCIVDNGKISKIIFLQRYSGEKFRKELITKNEMFGRLITTTHLEINDAFKYMLVAGGFNMIDTVQYYQKIFSIISNAIDTLKEENNELVLIPRAAKPVDLANYIR